MTRALVLAALAMLATLAMPAVTRSAAADPANDAAATQAYEDGKRLVDLREWTQAIAKFKEAYRRRPDATAMWAIAQTYQQSGDCVEATNFYRTFKRNFPADRNGAAADKAIAELDPCVRQRSADPTPLDPKPHDPNSGATSNATSTSSTTTTTSNPTNATNGATSGAAQVPETPHDDDPLATRRTIGKVVVLAGILGIATGVYFASDARSISDQVSGGGGTWNPDLESRGKAAQRNEAIAFALGGAAAVTGTILWVLARPSEPAHVPPVGIVPTTSGAFAVWSGRF